MDPLVRLARPSDLEAIAALFNGYRVFYEQRSDPSGARAFMRERLARRDSVVFVCTRGDDPSLVGFTQLYPSLSSVSMRRIFVLNDLFVAPEARRCGAARALMQVAHDHARAEGAVRVSLSTAVDNFPAQMLYESIGYCRNEVFHHYDLETDP